MLPTRTVLFRSVAAALAALLLFALPVSALTPGGKQSGPGVDKGAVRAAPGNEVFQVRAASGESIALVDSDGDRLVDWLQAALTRSAPGERHSVVVMLDRPADMGAIAVAAGHFTPQHVYSAALHGFAASLSAAQIRALQRLPGVVRIEPDVPVYAALDTATASAGVNKARDDWGLTGNRDGDAARYSKDDLVIAIVDTGVICS